MNTPHPASNASWTILVVDDEAPILSFIQELLLGRFPNATVTLAASGAEGLQLLARQDFDLILTDFRMPGMDGVDFLARSRLVRPGIGRMLVTGYADTQTAIRAVNEGHVHAILQKPVESDRLVAEVERLASQASAIRQREAAFRRSLDPAANTRPARAPFTGTLGREP